MEDKTLVDEIYVRDRIIELVDEKGVSDREASLGSGLSEGCINALRNHTKKPEGITSLLGICDYFGITPAEFFTPGFEKPIYALETLDSIESTIRKYKKGRKKD